MSGGSERQDNVMTTMHLPHVTWISAIISDSFWNKILRDTGDAIVLNIKWTNSPNISYVGQFPDRPRDHNLAENRE